MNAEPEYYTIDFLVEELKNDDPVVREDAVELLAEVGDPLAVEPLIQTLEDDDWHVREAAALSLATFDAVGAIGPLINLLEDEHPGVRYAAALSLSVLGDETALQSLEKVRDEDEDRLVRNVAKIALEEIAKRI